jgi:aryl-alcohol dehydrogenase-like predicted oxidoreductase
MEDRVIACLQEQIASLEKENILLRQSDMQYITLPGTDLRVSRLCLGTMQFAGSVEKGTSDVTWGAIDESTATATILAALDLGINFFDCAEAYGKNRQAEQALGKALKDSGRRHEAIIASKFGVHAPLWETDDPTGAAKLYSGSQITEAIESSLQMLQTTYIDLFQVHWPSNMGLDGNTGPSDGERWEGVKDCVAALETAKNSGKIRHYGVCNFGTTDMALFKEAGGNAVSNQVPYSLLWRSIEFGILPACKQADMGVLCYSALQQGLLSGKYSNPDQLIEGRRRTRFYRPDSTPKTKHGSPGLEQELFGDGTGGDGALAELRRVAEEEGVNMVDASIGWLLAQPGVHCVLVGASSPEQVQRNSKLAKLCPRVISAATAATDGLKQAVLEQGGWVDQYAKATRIHGNAMPSVLA